MRLATLLIAIVPLAAPGLARAQTAVQPDQVEEDWRVVIGTPDPAGASPQISTYMSPVEDGSERCFIFNLNYQDEPSFSPGGLEAQVWDGDQLISSNTRGSNQCSTPNETITWTQRMRLTSGTISFAIDSGRSTTWGRFGQGQQLNIGGTFPTTLTSLSRYAPNTSVAGSGVGFGSNRVTSMTLLQVRYYAGGKLLRTETAARPVSLGN